MQRIWIVLKNEFLKRVRSRVFIITTLLGPIILVGFFVVIGIVTVRSMEGGDRTIAVLDGTGRMADLIEADSDDQTAFRAVDLTPDSARAAVLRGDYTGYLELSPDLLSGEGSASYYALEGGLGGVFQRRLDRTVERAVKETRLNEEQVSQAVRDIMAGSVDLRMVKLTKSGDAAGDAGAYAIIGFIMGFLIYMAMLIYGQVVMQGVIEEKLSRVVEIIISSVKPFELLMGKVLGIGAMGLVQMTVWALLIMAGTMGSGAILSLFLDPAALNLPAEASQEELLAAANFQVPQLSPDVFIWFVLFFLVGYLLYASLFAAIGSAVDQQQDAQGIILPVMMPIILSIVFIQPVIEEPSSTLAVMLSMIPFFSPIPMVVRVAVSDVPFWQVSLSFVLLFATFIGAVWVSARIYRVGVLMYGKKASFRDLARWVRYA